MTVQLENVRKHVLNSMRNGIELDLSWCRTRKRFLFQVATLELIRKCKRNIRGENRCKQQQAVLTNEDAHVEQVEMFRNGNGNWFAYSKCV